MRILFLHEHFPGPFGPLARALGSDSRHNVVFGTARPAGNIPGVSMGLFRSDFAPAPETHPLTRPVETAIRTGQDAWRLARNLGGMNFIPDVIYGRAGSGPTLFMKDLVPGARLLCRFEWFEPSREPVTCGAHPADAAARLRSVPVLMDLYACDRGLSPTGWQRNRFPPEYRDCIDVIHDGIDAGFFTPAPGNAGIELPRWSLALPAGTEIVSALVPGSWPVP